MSKAHSTIEHLMKVIPGQSVAWYIRVGQQIHEGKMPMPSLDGQAPAVEAVVTSDRRLRNLLALCDGSKPKLNAMIEASCRRNPGKPMDWHLGQIETMLQPKEKATPQPTTTTATTQPAKPKDVVSEATKSQLLEVCSGNMAVAERLVADERRKAYSEENAWQRAYDKFMHEKINLYAKIGYYS
jgi:hypothetical protein